MPLVQISLLEGRSPEQIRDLHERVTAAVSEAAACPSDAVRVIVQEVAADKWSVGGVPKG